MYTFRFAEERDAAGILDIYSNYIEHTTVTFETEIPSVAAFANRIEGIIEAYPYIVCEANGMITGYAYASKHRERAAYRYDADMSVYIAKEHHGRRIGTALYSALFELLRTQGYINTYAGIALPNEKSIGFHKAMGFAEIGIYHNTGYKLGRWIDVLWMQKAIAPYPDNPTSPKGIRELGIDFYLEVLERAAGMINQ